MPSAYPAAFDSFLSVADNPYMNQSGRKATDIVAQLQESIAAVQSSIGVTGALNYIRATGSVPQDISGLKNFTTGIQSPWINFGGQRNSIGVDLQVFGGSGGNNFSRTDNAITTGAWRYDHTAGDTGGPFTERGVIFHSRRTNGGGESQLFVGEVSGRVASRGRVSGAWSDWKQLADTRRASFGQNAVGTFPANGALAALDGRTYLGSLSDIFALCVCYNAARAAGGTGFYIGATDSATPSLVLSNVGGQQLVELQNDGRLLIRRQIQPAQSIGLQARDTGNHIYGYSESTNAKQIIFDSTTDGFNTPPTGGGALGYIFRVLGVVRAVMNSLGNWGFGGNQAPTCAIDNDGYSSLGPGAPKIAIKELTGTLSSVTGAVVNVSHGLDVTKIISHSVQWTDEGNRIWPANTAEYPAGQVTYYFTSSNLVVTTGPSATNALNRPFVCLIVYKE